MSQQPTARAGRTALPAREGRRWIVRMIESKHRAFGNLKSSFPQLFTLDCTRVITGEMKRTHALI